VGIDLRRNLLGPILRQDMAHLRPGAHQTLRPEQSHQDKSDKNNAENKKAPYDGAPNQQAGHLHGSLNRKT